MVVGDTQTIHALDSAGQAVTGLTWTSSDPAVVSLSTADPPVLTAEAAGQVTITAGTVTAEVTVWADALPLGTVIWSNPGNGAGVYMIVPAVPSPDGVADVFAFQNDGTVQAITSEGATAWTADITWAWGALPDFQGGLLTVEYDGETESLVRINGATGQRTVLYELVYGETSQFVQAVGVHTDGTVFVVRGTGEELGRPAVVGIDGVAGGVKFETPFGPQAEIVDGGVNIIREGGLGAVGSSIIVAGDGYAYVPYGYQYYGGQPYVCQDHLRLLRIDSSGASSDLAIHDWTDQCVEGFSVGASTITNADQGILLSWTIGLYNGG
jgi:hypothetical protein